MSQLVVKIGEMIISNDINACIKTYALGSCIAVMLHDKKNLIGGMIHIALPESKVNPEKSKELPGYFADTGLPLLLDTMYEKGAQRKYMTIKMAGGARVSDPNAFFDIGKRNILATKKILWKYRLPVMKEEIGGTISRTVSLFINNGDTEISSGGKKWII